MIVINKLNCADTLHKNDEVMTIESVATQYWEEKVVKITIDTFGIKTSVNVLANDVLNAVKNATNK